MCIFGSNHIKTVYGVSVAFLSTSLDRDILCSKIPDDYLPVIEPTYNQIILIWVKLSTGHLGLAKTIKFRSTL